MFIALTNEGRARCFEDVLDTATMHFEAEITEVTEERSNP